MNTAEQLRNISKNTKEANERIAEQKRIVTAEYVHQRLQRITDNVPEYINNIISKCTTAATLGCKDYEEVLWDSEDRHDIAGLIIVGLREQGFSVVETSYLSPGSYGDHGEVFCESSHRIYLKISW